MNEDGFIIDLLDKCETREDWLTVSRFGLRRLLDDPFLLIEVITRRAEKEHAKSPGQSTCVADFSRVLMALLGLRFEISTPTEGTPDEQ